jgi:hypothetical protein
MISGFIGEQIFDERNQTRNGDFLLFVLSALLLIKCEAEVNTFSSLWQSRAAPQLSAVRELFFVFLIIPKRAALVG